MEGARSPQGHLHHPAGHLRSAAFRAHPDAAARTSRSAAGGRHLGLAGGGTALDGLAEAARPAVITTPLLVVGAGKDRICLTAQAKAFAARCAPCRLCRDRGGRARDPDGAQSPSAPNSGRRSTPSWRATPNSHALTRERNRAAASCRPRGLLVDLADRTGPGPGRRRGGGCVLQARSAPEQAVLRGMSEAVVALCGTAARTGLLLVATSDGEGCGAAGSGRGLLGCAPVTACWAAPGLVCGRIRAHPVPARHAQMRR